MSIEEIRSALRFTNPCQRNWDRSRVIPQEHVDLLVDAVRYAPCKQNETHYKVFYTTNEDLIYQIYQETKQYAVAIGNDLTNDKGLTQDEYNIRNSQVMSNIVFAVCHDWKQENSRSKIHSIVEERNEKAKAKAIIQRERHRHISMGVCIGELILTANLLGYRTGLCSAFDKSVVGRMLGNEEDECLVLASIGFPHKEKNRREHEEITNRDIVEVRLRNGDDDAKWKFPSFNKEVSIKRI